MGYLYQRGRIWWAKYYVNGRPVRESTGTEKEQAARTFLKTREGRAATGEPILPRVDRIRYDEIAADLRRHYETTGERQLKEADQRLNPLRRFFAGRRVVEITELEIQKYQAGRQQEQVSNATINRECGVLGRMLRLAYRNRKVLRLPIVDRLEEAAPRAGFFEDAAHRAVVAHLPPDARVAYEIAYTFGWRARSEVLRL